MERSRCIYRTGGTRVANRLCSRTESQSRGLGVSTAKSNSRVSQKVQNDHWPLLREVLMKIVQEFRKTLS